MKLALLIEDDPADARLFKIMVSAQGDLNCKIAQCLKDGIDLANQHAFDLCLLDLSLPDSHGVDTVRRIAEAAPRLPIVVLTGLDDEAVGVAAVHAGAQDYLVKGAVDGHLLRRTIRYAIERKAAALKMLAMAERHARIFDGLGEGVLEIAADGRILDCNPAALGLLETERNQLMGLRFGQLGGSTDRPGSATAAVDEVLASGRPATVYAAALSTAAGRPFQADLTITVGTDEDGGRVAFVALRDLADRNAAYASMRHSLSLQEQMVEAVPQPMFAVDALLQITHCNSAFASLLGSRVDQMLGFAVAEVLPEELLVLLPPVELGLALGAGSSRLDLKLAGGGAMTLLRRPLYDSDGHVAGFACVLTV